jgi:hypothetical protein
LVVFADLECEACIRLLSYLEKACPDHLSAGAHVVIVSPLENRNRATLFRQESEDFTWLFIDKEHWRNVYHLEVWPMALGVDSSGIITHIQFGFDGHLDFELIQRFLNKR